MNDIGRKSTAAALAAASVLALGVLTAPGAAASGRTQIAMQDRCEPESFNAAVDPDPCIAGNGDVTFEKFLDKLNPDDGGHGAWRFSREETHIDEGDRLVVRNTGGEFHSFTLVRNFGKGIVPELNAAVQEDVDAVPIAGNLGFAGPGDFVEGVPQLEPGTHLFQCLIHPWMRTTVEVRED